MQFDGDYSVVGQFKLDPQPELLDGSMFALPVGLRLLGRPGDVLLAADTTGSGHRWRLMEVRLSGTARRITAHLKTAVS